MCHIVCDPKHCEVRAQRGTMGVVTTMIEPGLLNLFRWYVGIRFVLLVAVLVGSRGDNPPSPPHYPEVGIILFGLLLILLVVPWFERVLGGFFLPLAIVLATVAPIAGCRFDHPQPSCGRVLAE